MSTAFYVPSGLPTTCPPTKVTTVKRTKHVKKRKGSAPVQTLPSGYAFVPPATPLTYPQSYHLIDAGPKAMNIKKVSVPVVGLPEGYVFVPPPVPLTYPESYHLVDAGPMNEAPRLKRKRTAQSVGDGGQRGHSMGVGLRTGPIVGDPDFFYEVMDVHGGESSTQSLPLSPLVGRRGDMHGGEVGSLVEFASPFPLVGRCSIFYRDSEFDSLSPQEAGAGGRLLGGGFATLVHPCRGPPGLRPSGRLIAR
ncbi:hypothetical protein C8R45DRAFT_1090111 [Mycena sanguinolenta]|nr:hypothetical protein C8R45DRAFT_1090111 [Mycena sanguinolenta]